MVELTYKSLYWSKALLASTSSLRRRADGMAPSSRGGSYLLLHGDLWGRQEEREKEKLRQLRQTLKGFEKGRPKPQMFELSRNAIIKEH